ncbi:MAG TPA: BrnT family toxin [Thermoanaerobaculia bacterium]|nr:BrnT family toxin [Thermoanaerobaculia bacterium]
MRIVGFVWLEEILDKLLRKHQVHESEVVEVFEGKPKFRFVERGHREGENVYSAMGQTDEGRYLVVFFVHKTGGRALPVSARDMTAAERKRYERT